MSLEDQMTATPQVEWEYLTCAETAKLVRVALKAAFPTTKFSVRSNTYSGGASIDIRYTDGPTTAAVDKVVTVYRGAEFDGMIDMQISTKAWLNPDGTATFAYTPGTEGSRGVIPEVHASRTHPDARLVSFGSDYISASRDLSETFRGELEAEIEAAAGQAYSGNTRYDLAVCDDGTLAIDRHRGEWGSTLVWQMSARRDRTEGSK